MAGEDDLGEGPMGKESAAIFEDALDVGRHRLSRHPFETSVSAFIAGMYVTFSALATVIVYASVLDLTGSEPFAWLAGSIAYPIGFIFVVVGKSELFTENFVSPVLSAWEGEGSYVDLLWLWAIALVFNIVGVMAMSFFVGEFGLLGRSYTIEGFATFSHHLTGDPFGDAFIKGIFGGLLINFMSWLVIASRGTGAKVIMIFIPTFLISLIGAFHSIAGSAEVLIAVFLGADVTVLDWFIRFFVPAGLGNLIGGVVFVAALHYLQVSNQLRYFR